MAITGHVTKLQQGKVDALEAIKEKIRVNQDFIFTDYRGLTVGQITELRTRLREKRAEYRVMKNRYVRLAFEQLHLPDVAAMLVGPTALTLLQDDAAAVAKVLYDYARETPITVKGAVVGGRVYTGDQIEALSRLPGREHLLAQLMGTMNAPLQNLVYAMNGVTVKLARTLQAVADRKSGHG